eukprot:Amastigsp_a677380_13.p2 type:complete len:368 gc:universal Amastigsp_a677380_13:1051-2154(+)
MEHVEPPRHGALGRERQERGERSREEEKRVDRKLCAKHKLEPERVRRSAVRIERAGRNHRRDRRGARERKRVLHAHEVQKQRGVAVHNPRHREHADAVEAREQRRRRRKETVHVARHGEREQKLEPFGELLVAALAADARDSRGSRSDGPVERAALKLDRREQRLALRRHVLAGARNSAACDHGHVTGTVRTVGLKVHRPVCHRADHHKQSKKPKDAERSDGARRLTNVAPAMLLFIDTVRCPAVEADGRVGGKHRGKGARKARVAALGLGQELVEHSACARRRHAEPILDGAERDVQDKLARDDAKPGIRQRAAVVEPTEIGEEVLSRPERKHHKCVRVLELGKRREIVLAEKRLRRESRRWSGWR